jgi:hypothetical protein
MEKKNITMYVLLVLIGFIVILGLVNSFRTSKSLIKAKESIDSALVLVVSSNDILKNQGLAIDNIKLTNTNLLGVINDIDSTSKRIKESLVYRINKNNRELDSIMAILNRMKDKEKLHN